LHLLIFVKLCLKISRQKKGDLMEVKEIMVEEVETIGEKENLEIALKKTVKEGECGSLIVEKDGEVVGIITTWDILAAIGENDDLKNVEVQDAMETHLVTVHTDTSVEQAAREMVEHGIWRLPVEEAGQIVGIVSATDILLDRSRKIM
jgi:CBS domain-containing protein